MIPETVKYEGKKRVLILGSSGQIGAYLTEYLKEKDYDVRKYKILVCRLFRQEKKEKKLTNPEDLFNGA